MNDFTLRIFSCPRYMIVQMLLFSLFLRFKKIVLPFNSGGLVAHSCWLFIEFDLFIEAFNVSLRRRQDIQRTFYTCIPLPGCTVFFTLIFYACVIFTFLVSVTLICSGFGTFEVGVSSGIHNFSFIIRECQYIFLIKHTLISLLCLNTWDSLYISYVS